MRGRSFQEIKHILSSVFNLTMNFPRNPAGSFSLENGVLQSHTLLLTRSWKKKCKISWDAAKSAGKEILPWEEVSTGRKSEDKKQKAL